MPNAIYGRHSTRATNNEPVDGAIPEPKLSIKAVKSGRIIDFEPRAHSQLLSVLLPGPETS